MELEEGARHPGVLVFSSSHQMLPGGLQGTGCGEEERRVGSCRSKAEMGLCGWRQILASCQTAGSGEGRAGKCLLADERAGPDGIHNGHVIIPHHSFISLCVNLTRIYSLAPSSAGHGPATPAHLGNLSQTPNLRPHHYPAELEPVF